ncbi:hypothetical protein BH23ACT5_BH23ACT5_02100 [soil metagenome]
MPDQVLYPQGVIFLALLLAGWIGGAGSGDEPVLVRRAPTVQAGDDGTAVLGWQRVDSADVDPGEETVPVVYLDLLEGTNEPLYDDQWALERIGAPAAWAMTTGDSSVVIAVIDSGIDSDHPDIAGRLFINPGEIPDNGIDDDGNDLIDDVSGWDVIDWDNDPTDPGIGHGPGVASVAIASVNGFGMAGVAPTAKVLPIRACTNQCDLLHVAWAIVYATDMGADIINLSLGGFAQPGPVADAVEYAHEGGVLVVAAAGNAGADIDSGDFIPAGLPGVVAVAATNSDGDIWPSSNWGNELVDLGAPGVGILAVALDPPEGHEFVTGTSYAAPHVSGVAALMLSVRPGLTPDEVVALMSRHGAPSNTLTDRTVSGVELQADRTVAAARWRDIHESVFDAEIVTLGLRGVTRGCNPPLNDLFCPERAITRGEMAAFLSRALGLEPGPVAFTDHAGSVFRRDIDALAAAGITRGCDPPQNDRFCPDRAVTRGEMAAFITRAFELGAGDTMFTDAAASSFTMEIEAVGAAGISRGCNPPENSLFCPDRLVTRGEMAAFLNRAEALTDH